MRKKSKRYREVASKVDTRLYDPKEAMTIIKECTTAKFDESVELHFNLGIDPRHAEQQIRGTFNLPHGTGKSVRVAAIVQPDLVKKVTEAGADEVGSDDLVEKINGGWMNFDVLISTPEMMSKVGKLGKVLGARGLMPSPKSGTVIKDPEVAVKEFKAGKIEYRNDKLGLIHLVIGKGSFALDKLVDNFMAIYDVIAKAKPGKSKGIYLKSVVLSTTMGPGVHLEPLKVRWKEGV